MPPLSKKRRWNPEHRTCIVAECSWEQIIIPPPIHPGIVIETWKNTSEEHFCNKLQSSKRFQNAVRSYSICVSVSNTLDFYLSGTFLVYLSVMYSIRVSTPWLSKLWNAIRFHFFFRLYTTLHYTTLHSSLLCSNPFGQQYSVYDSFHLLYYFHPYVFHFKLYSILHFPLHPYIFCIHDFYRYDLHNTQLSRDWNGIKEDQLTRTKIKEFNITLLISITKPFLQTKL